MTKFLTKLSIFALIIRANSKIVFRLTISIAIIFLVNLIYTKYESLLLTTNPEKLFIPLYIYTGIVVVLIVWTLLSFKWIASLKEAKSKLEITNSYKNKSNEYEKIKDVLTYPELKTKKDTILEDL